MWKQPPGAHQGKRIVLALACASLVALTGCSASVRESAEVARGKGLTRQVLRLATTTSTRDSGLLDELLPAFEQAQGCRVDVIAAGTGAALKLGEAGDVDAVLVHARAAEEAFMQAKHGIRQEEFMYNDFVLLGPRSDPAQIRGVEPIAALGRIAEGKHGFVSRGDNSGTHQRELSLWESAGGRPAWEAYLEAGQGMGPVLVMADQKQAYVLADMGTYLNFQDKIDLIPLAAAAQSLRNPYAVIVVDPRKHNKINGVLASALADYLISGDAQRRIAGYRIAGQQLFYPTRLGES